MHLHPFPLSSALLIIPATLQLVWKFHPCVHHPLGVMMRFLRFSSSRDSSSSLLQSSSTSLLQLQASTLFHLSITFMTSLHSTGRFLETLQLLWHLHRSIFESPGKNHQWFLAVTVRTLKWSLAMLAPSTYVTTDSDHWLHRHSTFRLSCVKELS
jgi:hypothetical protein